MIDCISGKFVTCVTAFCVRVQGMVHNYISSYHQVLQSLPSISVQQSYHPVEYWATGRAIDRTHGAQFISKFISLVCYPHPSIVLCCFRTSCDPQSCKLWCVYIPVYALLLTIGSMPIRCRSVTATIHI